MNRPLVTTPQAILAIRYRWLTVGFVCGVVSAIGVVYAARDIHTVHADEAGLIAACRLPSVDGAVTIWQMRGGKLECGRYQ